MLKQLRFDRYVLLLLLKNDVDSVFNSVAHILTNEEAKVIFVHQILESLDNELSAERVLLVVLEVGVENETDASPIHHMMAEVLANPT